MLPNFMKKSDNFSQGKGGGALLEILGGGVLSGSPNPDPISDQKCHFHTHFQTCPLRNYVIIT